MDALLDHAFKLNDSMQISKFTCLVLNSANYPNGCSPPAAANAAKLAGVAQESVMPNGFSDYANGVYTIVTGTAWPAGAIPDSAKGRGINLRMAGITRVIAAAAIAIGDRVNIADVQGRVKTITEAAGTIVNEVGWAMEAAAQAGDVIKIMMTNIQRPA